MYVLTVWQRLSCLINFGTHISFPCNNYRCFVYILLIYSVLNGAVAQYFQLPSMWKMRKPAFFCFLFHQILAEKILVKSPKIQVCFEQKNIAPTDFVTL